GQRLHRGRRHSVAARRARADPERRREPGAGRVGPGHRRCPLRPRLRRPGCSLLGHVCARDDRGAHARDDWRPPGAGGARGDRLPEPRRPGGDGSRCRDRRARAARGRRRRRQRLPVPVPGGRPRGRRASAADHRDDGARRRLPGRARRGALALAGRRRAALGPRAAVRAESGRRDASGAIRWLAAGGGESRVADGLVVEWKARPEVEIFWGGEPALFEKLAEQKLLQKVEIAREVWDSIPASIGTPKPIPLKDKDGYWIGTALEPYGLVYHPKKIQRLGIPEPREWDDLLNPKLKGEVAQCAPTRSSSSNATYEVILSM